MFFARYVLGLVCHAGSAEDNISIVVQEIGEESSEDTENGHFGAGDSRGEGFQGRRATDVET